MKLSFENVVHQIERRALGMDSKVLKRWHAHRVAAMKEPVSRSNLYLAYAVWQTCLTV